MGTATSRPVTLGIAALALGIAGCGAAGKPTGSFSWLRPGPAPARWHTVSITSGAALSYPPGWRAIHGDQGTATAALRDSHNDFLGYLNLTPRQGDETLSNWKRFRAAHNAHEGDRQVRTLEASQRLRFRGGHGVCVRDAYATATGARYIELACLVKGRKSTSVIVGAAPPHAWPQIAPTIERAISALTT